MFEFAPPGGGDLRERLARLSDAPFSYREVGASDAPAFPSGYRADCHRRRLGYGAACHRRAKAAFQRWKMFDLDWVRLSPPVPSIAARTVVGISARLFGLWLFNIGRIAYVVDQEQPPFRFGFGLGTLQGHALSGEERFCIEWHASDDSVWYDIRTFSRPQTMLALAAYPLVRALQERFVSDSCAAMARACTVEAGAR